MARIRTKKISSYHQSLGNGYFISTQKSSFGVYALRHSAYHYARIPSEKKLWTLLQDETFRSLQYQREWQTTDCYMALQQGFAHFIKNPSIQSDAKFAWIGCRSGRLSDNVQLDLHRAFEWFKEDAQKLTQVLDRIDHLNNNLYSKACFLLLCIEVERQKGKEQNKKDNNPPRIILDSMMKRAPSKSEIGSGFTRFLADLVGFWAIQIIHLWPELSLDIIYKTTDNRERLLEIFFLHSQRCKKEGDELRLNHVSEQMKRIQELMDDYDRNEYKEQVFEYWMFQNDDEQSIAAIYDLSGGYRKERCFQKLINRSRTPAERTSLCVAMSVGSSTLTPGERSSYYMCLARNWLDLGEQEKSIMCLEKVVQYAENVEGFTQKTRILRRASNCYVDMDSFEAAVSIIQRIEFYEEKLKALEHWVLALRKKNIFQSLPKWVETLEKDVSMSCPATQKYAQASIGLMQALPVREKLQNEGLDKALALNSLLSSPISQYFGLMEMASVFAQRGDIGKVRALLNDSILLDKDMLYKVTLSQAIGESILSPLLNDHTVKELFDLCTSYSMKRALENTLIKEANRIREQNEEGLLAFLHTCMLCQALDVKMLSEALPDIIIGVQNEAIAAELYRMLYEKEPLGLTISIQLKFLNIFLARDSQTMVAEIVHTLCTKLLQSAPIEERRGVFVLIDLSDALLSVNDFVLSIALLNAFIAKVEEEDDSRNLLRLYVSLIKHYQNIVHSEEQAEFVQVLRVAIQTMSKHSLELGLMELCVASQRQGKHEEALSTLLILLQEPNTRYDYTAQLLLEIMRIKISEGNEDWVRQEASFVHKEICAVVDREQRDTLLVSLATEYACIGEFSLVMHSIREVSSKDKILWMDVIDIVFAAREIDTVVALIELAESHMERISALLNYVQLSLGRGWGEEAFQLVSLVVQLAREEISVFKKKRQYLSKEIIESLNTSAFVFMRLEAQEAMEDVLALLSQEGESGYLEIIRNLVAQRKIKRAIWFCHKVPFFSGKLEALKLFLDSPLEEEEKKELRKIVASCWEHLSDQNMQNLRRVSFDFVDICIRFGFFDYARMRLEQIQNHAHFNIRDVKDEVWAEGSDSWMQMGELAQARQMIAEISPKKRSDAHRRIAKRFIQRGMKEEFLALLSEIEDDRLVFWEEAFPVLSSQGVDEWKSIVKLGIEELEREPNSVEKMRALGKVVQYFVAINNPNKALEYVREVVLVATEISQRYGFNHCIMIRDMTSCLQKIEVSESWHIQLTPMLIHIASSISVGILNFRAIQAISEYLIQRGELQQAVMLSKHIGALKDRCEIFLQYLGNEDQKEFVPRMLSEHKSSVEFYRSVLGEYQSKLSDTQALRASFLYCPFDSVVARENIYQLWKHHYRNHNFVEANKILQVCPSFQQEYAKIAHCLIT